MDTSRTDGTSSPAGLAGGVESVRRVADRHWSEPASAGPDRAAHGLLLLVAVWAVWFPVETWPLTAVVAAGAVLALIVWGWNRCSERATSSVLSAVVIAAVLVASGASGWDPSRAVGGVGLVAAVVSFAWLASRSRPPDGFPVVMALGLAGLALWGLWQAAVGLEGVRTGLDSLPEAARAYAEERLASRRAFASLPLPSHLAVLLATALPLLLSRVRATVAGGLWAVAAGVVLAGLVATRSPVGLGLALAAAAATVLGGRRRLALAAILALVLALAAVVAVRPDVGRLEPVALRLDNWWTAVWLWSTAPATGAGVASFAQATQSAPLEVGNRPAHAHSLLLEGLAELGPAGLVGCLALALALAGLVRGLWPRQRALAAAVAVVPLHNLVDFSLFTTGVAVPWAVLVGWAAAHRGEPGATAEPRPVRGRVLLVGAASVALAAVTFHATSVVVEGAAASQGEPLARFAGALRALELAPWRVEPQFLLAAAALQSGDPAQLDRAWSELDRRRWWRPRSAALAERRARLALARGDASRALAELWAAVASGFPDPERRRAFHDLVTALENGGYGPSS